MNERQWNSKVDEVRLGEGLRSTSRRDFGRHCASVASYAALANVVSPVWANPAADGCLLGFSTYGMKQLSTEDALQRLAEIGFDSVELTVREDWDADSAKWSEARARTVRKILSDSGLRLTSFMEHVFPSEGSAQKKAMDRLKRAGELAHRLSPENPPLIQTVLGGGKFEEKRAQLVESLAQWSQLAEAMDTTIAIKPHRGGVVSQPAEAVWLLKQLEHPKRLRMVYDYSHYAYRDLTIEETVQTALPYVAHVAVKDAVQEGDRVLFKLPGETGAIDFVKLLSLLYAGGYRGDINCEVSGMVWNKPDYDAVAAAKSCYKAMKQAFQDAGVPRSV